MSTESENKGRNKGWDNLIPLKPGETANPNGRPKGQRNYATIQAEAIRKLGVKLGKTPEEIEEDIIQNGLARANQGDYRYYKDALDRTHGTALMMSRVDHSGEVKVNTNVDFDSLIKKADELLKQEKLNAKQADKGGSSV